MNWSSATTLGCIFAGAAGLLGGAAIAAGAAPFSVRGPGVAPSDFRVTTFAQGLDYPLGMARLSDGSLLVAVSEGPSFGDSIGQLVRLVDEDRDGVTDGPAAVVHTGLPDGQTALRMAGRLAFVTGQGRGKPITILRAGPSPAAALSRVGRIDVNYPGSWHHPHSALFARELPGQPDRCELFFQLGSQFNFNPTIDTASISSVDVAGATGVLQGDSIYRLTITDHGDRVTATDLTRIASGLRNATGFDFHPATGDFYFQDNGIDGLSNPNEPLSADELNVIPAAELGGTPAPFFGFPTDYVEYRTGRRIGSGGVLPLVAFQPLPSPVTGDESEGPNDIVFAPPTFPNGLNNGIFLGFHGRFNAGGLANEENPVVYVDLAGLTYFHFIGTDEPNIGHLDGLLATEDSLFLADLAANGNLSNGGGRGIIYQIKSLVLPPIRVIWTDDRLELAWSHGRLQEADSLEGPWNDVPGATSPYAVEITEGQKFFRASEYTNPSG
jgi:glucose/arabinose dehydrogenase